jgi:hypothetical protein
MTEQEYAEIAAACDRLLRAPSTSIARLAIPALHLLNERPSSLAQYAPLSAQGSDSGFPNFPRAVIRAARGLARSLGARQGEPQHRNPVDVVIVSHLLKADQLNRSGDFYFGALQSQLQDHGITSLLVLISHLGHTAWSAPPGTLPRTILAGPVSPPTEVGIWRQCANASRNLRQEAARSRNLVDRQLAILASQQALSASTADNLRMHASVARICQAVNPKIVITTYEGTVAERLIWHAARTARRRPLCVGYQHALILQRAHAIRRPVAAPGVDCDPDVILTLGEIPHKALASSPELRSVRLIEYGSHRRAPLPALPRLQDRPRQCLVLPDADAHECAMLFDFALASARRSPTTTFSLRPHPMVDLQALLRRQPALQHLPGNVSLSVDKPLVQDFAQARYCLYRGSSAALHAVLAGIKPYYLAQPGELPFDCLSALTEWRETVTSPEDLTSRMNVADLFTEPAAAALAANFCERYVAPLRPAAINELLAIAGEVRQPPH